MIDLVGLKPSFYVSKEKNEILLDVWDINHESLHTSYSKRVNAPNIDQDIIKFFSDVEFDDVPFSIQRRFQ